VVLADPARPRSGVVRVGISCGIPGDGDGGERGVDTGGERVDLRAERVDLFEQHPGQFGVVIIELAGQRLDQVGVLELHPAAGLIGKQWIGAVDEVGRRRLDDPDDWIVQEIGASLTPRYPSDPDPCGRGSYASTQRATRRTGAICHPHRLLDPP